MFIKPTNHWSAEFRKYKQKQETGQESHYIRFNRENHRRSTTSSNKEKKKETQSQNEEDHNNNAAAAVSEHAKGKKKD